MPSLGQEAARVRVRPVLEDEALLLGALHARKLRCEIRGPAARCVFWHGGKRGGLAKGSNLGGTPPALLVQAGPGLLVSTTKVFESLEVPVDGANVVSDVAAAVLGFVSGSNGTCLVIMFLLTPKH